MAKKTLEKTKQTKQKVSVDVFAGIDRSTSRYRIEGDGQRLYEASNVFPYIQGLLQRRRDAVTTNSRTGDGAFPSFPAQAIGGTAIIKEVVEFNDEIVIFYVDSASLAVILADRFSPASNGINAITGLLIADAVAIDSGGTVQATPYKRDATAGALLHVARDGIFGLVISTSWGVSNFDATNTDMLAVSEVFLSTLFQLRKTEYNRISRTAVGGNSFTVNYNLANSVGLIMRMISFGYQTSSAGATSVMVIFKPSSTWVITGIGATESFEQITGNIGLAGLHAITYTPFGLCFVGRDTDGLLNLYLLDRNSLALHTIGHELYEELNDIPKANYTDIQLSFYRNRMIRITITKTGDSVVNNKEYWMDFYNGMKKRTLWGPNHLPASNILRRSISFSGGNTPANSGFFMLLEESSVIKIYEDVDTDTFDSTDTEWDDQIWRTKMYDFGRVFGLVLGLKIIALANGAKFKVYHETPKASGDDDDTTQTLIGSYTMGTGGSYVTKPIRFVPPLLRHQIGFKIESDYGAGDPNPFEMSQFEFEYELTDREVVE